MMMLRVAVTGASGHLGQIMVPYLEAYGMTVIPIGHDIEDDVDADAVIHLAAPDHRDEDAIRSFYYFNGRLKSWSEHHPDAYVINTGSWWQRCEGEAQELAYTRLKHVQQEALGDVTLIPYSVYGHAMREGRGFIPQLIEHMKGGARLKGTSRQARDWIHATDVCAAYLVCLRDHVEGVYDVATGYSISPHAIVRQMTGEDLPDYVEYPNCEPPFDMGMVPNWAAHIDVFHFVDVEVCAA
jgi:nucleoside-diphosphate-sugar epimerase